MRSQFPIAYHLTFGTYGTRLHGDERGTVDRTMTQPGDPIIGAVEDWERMEQKLLNFPARIFDAKQMILVESLIPDVCVRGAWQLHACAAGPDHVHTVLRADADGKDVRKWFKRWLTQSLSQHIALKENETFWSECGSVKWIWTNEYFQRAVEHVQAQRATR